MDSELIEDLMGYNLIKRSRQIQHISTRKWECRLKGETYERELDPNREISQTGKAASLCKNQPKMMIKYINIQTALCPKCKQEGIKTRCSRNHLKYSHKIEVKSIVAIMNKLVKLNEAEEAKRGRKEAD